MRHKIRTLTAAAALIAGTAVIATRPADATVTSAKSYWCGNGGGWKAVVSENNSSLDTDWFSTGGTDFAWTRDVAGTFYAYWPVQPSYVLESSDGWPTGTRYFAYQGVTYNC